jgi:hypothetical protein
MDGKDIRRDVGLGQEVRQPVRPQRIHPSCFELQPEQRLPGIFDDVSSGVSETYEVLKTPRPPSPRIRLVPD